MDSDRARQLPVRPRLLGDETIGSFLNRLARDNGLRTKTLIRQLAPALNRRQITPATDTATYWRPADLERLADLAGRPLNRLQLAIPAIADALADREPAAANTVIRACDHCAATKGITAAVYRRARPHDHLCHRHRRWLRTATTDLTYAPEILRAQRRLDDIAQRHDDADLSRALADARAVVSAWLAHVWHPVLHQRWDQRSDTLLGPTPHRPRSRTAIMIAATLPETATIATALLSCSTAADREHELSNLALTLGLPDGRVPGERDPLRRFVMQFGHGTSRG